MPGISGDIQRTALGAGIKAWVRMLLSFSGRARRKTMIGVFCMLLISLATLKSEGSLRWWPTQLVTVVSMLFLLWVYIATTVRRLHDVGRSGNWVFLLLVPAASQIVTILLCCVPAKQVDNDYGADPRESTAPVLPMRWKVVACVVLYWCLMSFMACGTDDMPDADRWLQLLIIAGLPIYALWLPWWLWTTFRERRSAEPSQWWIRRIGIAISVSWLLALSCIAFGGFPESSLEACIVIVLFGVLPLGFLWLVAWLWKKIRAGRVAA